MKDESVWTCDYCDKEFLNKKESDSHENYCSKNPIILSKNNKLKKLYLVSGVIWIISIVLFSTIALIFGGSPEKGQNTTFIFKFTTISFLVSGSISFLLMIVFLAYGTVIRSNSKFFSTKGLINFVVSLVFLPIVLMRSLAGFLFGFFILLPIWGLGILVVVSNLGLIPTQREIIGKSMNPTLSDKEIISMQSITFASKLFTTFNRGDIITFSSGRTIENGEVADYVKRIVGIAGDEIEIRDGFLFVNGKIAEEPYTLKPRSTFGSSFLQECKSIRIPKDYLFVLGDNRKRSKDSRDIGLVSIKEINGFLPVNKQTIFKDKVRLVSNDSPNQGMPSFELEKYYELINQIRTDNKLKSLKRNEKLEKAALARAKSIIDNNEVNKLESDDKGKYPYDKAIRDAGYSNIITGEVRTTGYYDAEELSNYWLEYETKKNLLDERFLDTGIAAYIGKIDGCEVQVIVQMFGGYVPPNYEKSTIDGWGQTLNRLKEIQPSWQRVKEWGSKYDNNKTDFDRINQIIATRIGNIQNAVNKMEKNQWLSPSESKGLDQDMALSNEQEKLANKLNSL